MENCETGVISNEQKQPDEVSFAKLKKWGIVINDEQNRTFEIEPQIRTVLSKKAKNNPYYMFGVDVSTVNMIAPQFLFTTMFNQSFYHLSQKIAQKSNRYLSEG